MQNRDTLSKIVLSEFSGIEYIRQSQLIPNILPFSSATLWRMVKDKKFPAPIKLSERITAWKTADIKSWLENLHKEAAAA